MKFSSSTLANFLVSAPRLTLNSLPDHWWKLGIWGELSRSRGFRKDGEKKLLNPNCNLLKGEEKADEVSSPGARGQWQMPLSTATDISAPEARVETDVKYFFHFWEILKCVPSSSSSLNDLKTTLCKHGGLSHQVTNSKLQGGALEDSC